MSKGRKTLRSVLDNLKELEKLETTAEGKHVMFEAMHSLCMYACGRDEESSTVTVSDTDDTEEEIVSRPRIGTKRKRRRKRTTRPQRRAPRKRIPPADITKDMEELLMIKFNQQAYPLRNDIRDIAEEIGSSYEKVNKWFANQRSHANKTRRFVPLFASQAEFLHQEFDKNPNMTTQRAGALAGNLSRMGRNIFSRQVTSWFENHAGIVASESSSSLFDTEPVQLTDEQTAVLHLEFIKNPKPSAQSIQKLSEQLDLPVVNIKKFFKRNRKIKRQLSTDPSFSL